MKMIASLPQTKFLRTQGLYSFVSAHYTDEQWISSNFSARGKRSKQYLLFVCLRRIFPQHFVIEEYQPSIFFRSGRNLKLDFFVPTLSVAIEYQGEHHYDDLPSGFGALEVYKEKDREKIELCKQYNVKLMLVPYWWDQKQNQLGQLFVI